MEKKIQLKTDYTHGAHPRVLEALVATNDDSTPGYGEDIYCARAKRLILDACRAPEHEVHFMVGGTQTNATVIAALLRPTQGVLAADTAHINVHEAGAVEATGHKVIILPQRNGKIAADDLDRYITDFYADETWPHMVEPGMVYITFPTELGALYTRHEFEQIYSVCRKWGKPLYIDGARLGYGLAAAPDLRLSDIPKLCDIFYIGGTKQGALFGEAVVARPGLLHSFMSITKQHGGLLAKGRLLGVQFEALFTGELYGEISRKAVKLAQRLRKAFEDEGFEPAVRSLTNQQFFTLPNAMVDRLAEHVDFEIWGFRGPEASTVRFVTGWATTDADIDRLAELIPQLR